MMDDDQDKSGCQLPYHDIYKSSNSNFISSPKLQGEAASNCQLGDDVSNYDLDADLEDLEAFLQNEALQMPVEDLAFEHFIRTGEYLEIPSDQGQNDETDAGLQPLPQSPPIAYPDMTDQSIEDFGWLDHSFDLGQQPFEPQLPPSTFTNYENLLTPPYTPLALPLKAPDETQIWDQRTHQAVMADVGDSEPPMQYEEEQRPSEYVPNWHTSLLINGVPMQFCKPSASLKNP
jgi:hypothetical protein